MIPEADRKRALDELEIPEDIYDELIEDFIAMAYEEIAKIETLITKGTDLVSAKKVAHSIKGAAANLRLEPAKDICLFMELKAESFEEIAVKIKELKKEIEILKQ